MTLSDTTNDGDSSDLTKYHNALAAESVLSQKKWPLHNDTLVFNGLV